METKLRVDAKALKSKAFIRFPRKKIMNRGPNSGGRSACAQVLRGSSLAAETAQ